MFRKLLRIIKTLLVLFSKFREWNFKIFCLINLHEILFIIRNLNKKIDIYDFIDEKDLFNLNENVEEFKGYSPVPEYFLKNIFIFLNKNNLINNYTLVDLGSGLGRVLCYSSKYNFKKIIGIELSKILYAKSLLNINKLKNKNNIECVNYNFLEYSFLKENTVFFMHDTVRKKGFEQFIIKVHNELKNHKVLLAYYNPTYDFIIESDIKFKKIKDNKLKNKKGFCIYKLL